MGKLSGLAVGGRGRVKSVSGGLRRRLYDLGFTPGTEAECLFAARGRGMRAYRVRGAVVALREKDAGQVWLEEEKHE